MKSLLQNDHIFTAFLTYIHSTLESNHDKSITEIKELVINDLADWKGNAEQNDDITFVGIKFGEAQCSTFQLNYLHYE